MGFMEVSCDKLNELVKTMLEVSRETRHRCEETMKVFGAEGCTELKLADTAESKLAEAARQFYQLPRQGFELTPFGQISFDTFVSDWVNDKISAEQFVQKYESHLRTYYC